jgi:hypothetical protein|nr:MAG TPA: hypothetical protein [Caudoviricetes sp.]
MYTRRYLFGQRTTAKVIHLEFVIRFQKWRSKLSDGIKERSNDMDGITILNVTEVSENSTLLLVALIFLVIGAIINTANLLLSDDTEHCVLYGIFTVTLLVLSIVVGFTMDKDR